MKAERITEFYNFMIDLGIEPPRTIVADGGFHSARSLSDKPGKSSGWYTLRSDASFGIAGSFKTGVKRTWRAKNSIYEGGRVIRKAPSDKKKSF